MLLPWPSPARGVWEIDLIEALATRLECSAQDAIDITEVWGALLDDAYADGIAPAETARLLAERLQVAS